MAEKETEITENGAVELDETALDSASGGATSAFPSEWKVSSFDGKGNDVATEEIAFVTGKIFSKL